MARFIQAEARHVELQDGDRKKTLMMFKYSEHKISLPSLRGRERKVPLAINDLEKTEEFWNAVLLSPSTPKYWKKFEPRVDLKLLSTRKPFYDKYEINDEYFEAIENLIEKTWNPKFVGHGKDARSLNHSGIKIRKIERIENIELFNNYSSKRGYVIRSMLRKGYTKYPDLGDLTKGGEIMTKGSDILNKSLYLDINEHYVFHGTKPDLIGNISKYGLDPRKSTGGKMLGKGIYGAENPMKADQYAGKFYFRRHNIRKMNLKFKRFK